MGKPEPKNWRRRAAVAALLPLLAVAACGSDDSADDSGSADTTTATTTATGSSGATATTAAPRDEMDTEATLRFQLTIPPRNFDPHKSASFAEASAYLFPVYDRLTMIDTKGVVQPMLATEWAFAPDGTSLQLKLRTDVKFHTGKPVDAAAVKASLERAKTLPESTQAGVLASVSTIDVVDPATVKLNLSKGNAGLPATLATAAGAIVDTTAPGIADLATNPGNAGSGAYLLDAYVANQTASFNRSADPYWDPDAAFVKRLEMVFTSDQAARINAVQTNAADLAYMNIGQSLNVEGVSGEGKAFQLYSLPSQLQVVLVLNLDRDTFTDPLVRQAVKQAIDAETIAHDLLSDECVAVPGLYPPSSWAYGPVNDPFPYDPAAAKAKLAQAGVSDLSFDSIVGAGSASNDVAVAVQAQLAEVGIKMAIEALPQPAQLARVQADDYEVNVSTLTAGADPGDVITNGLIGGMNVLKPQGTELAPLAAAAADPALDQSERAAIYQDASQLVADNVWYEPVCFITTNYWASAKVGGVADMVWIGVFDARTLYVKK